MLALHERPICFSLVDKRWTIGARGEPAPSQGLPIKITGNFRAVCALFETQQGMAVMRGDNITVGSKSTTPKPTSAIPDKPAEPAVRRDGDSRDPARTKRADVSGAMSQQRCDS